MEFFKYASFSKSWRAPLLQTAVGIIKSQDKYLADYEETICYLRRGKPASTSTPRSDISWVVSKVKKELKQ
jgi:hypothetical protein